LPTEAEIATYRAVWSRFQRSALPGPQRRQLAAKLEAFEVAFDHINAYIPTLSPGVPPIGWEEMQEIVSRVREAVRASSTGRTS
jgi:hypothetical protein